MAEIPAPAPRAEQLSYNCDTVLGKAGKTAIVRPAHALSLSEGTQLTVKDTQHPQSWKTAPAKDLLRESYYGLAAAMGCN